MKLAVASTRGQDEGGRHLSSTFTDFSIAQLGSFTVTDSLNSAEEVALERVGECFFERFTVLILAKCNHREG